MSKIRKFLTSFQVPLFFLTAFLLSWWPAPVMNGQILPHGPALAAVIILALTAGRQGLRNFWNRLKRWPAWYWFLVGPAMIAGYQGAAFGINLLLGAAVSNPPALSTGIFLELLLLGGMWEEPGWTGYALPKLQERYVRRSNGGLIAILILAVFRAIWHLPLLIYGHIFWFDLLIFEFAFQAIIAWLYNRSGGSVLVVMVFHFTSNLLGAAMSQVFTGSDRTTYYALFMSLALLIALATIKYAAPKIESAFEISRAE